MNPCPNSAARAAAPLAPALQLIAITAASWNLMAPVRPRRRVRRIALRNLARLGARPQCGAAGAA